MDTNKLFELVSSILCTHNATNLIKVLFEVECSEKTRLLFCSADDTTLSSSTALVETKFASPETAGAGTTRNSGFRCYVGGGVSIAMTLLAAATQGQP